MNGVYAVILLFICSACGKQSSVISNDEVLSGQSQKSWIRITPPEDDQIKEEEMNHSLTFLRNGNVTVSQNGETKSGTWTMQVDELTIEMSGNEASESFKIVSLTRKELMLRQTDGTVLTFFSD